MVNQNGKTAFEQFRNADKHYLENFIKISGLYCYLTKKFKGKEKQLLLNRIEKIIKNGIYFYERSRINDLRLLNKISKSDKTDIRLLSTSIDPTKLSPEDIIKLYESKEEKEREYENLKKALIKTKKDLSKFTSPEQEKENAVEIYLRLIKKIKFIPTYEALELASGNKISSSTWQRKFTGDIGFLDTLQNEIEKLINRSSIKLRKKFYTDVYVYIGNTYDNLLFQKFDEKILKKVYIDEETGNELSFIDYITNRKQFDDFVKTNKYS
jgi:hypothetical protein